MIDMIEECMAVGVCEDIVIPKPGQPAVGICKREDVSCGSYIEIRGGIAQAPYHVD